MLLRRAPHSALAPFVERLWHFDEIGDVGSPRFPRERALPTGSTTLVFRLSPEPIRLFEDARDEVGRTYGHSVVAGARSSFHLRDTSAPSWSVGAQFRPGGAAALLGFPADALSERHTPLEALWGEDAHRERERLLEARTPLARIARLEELLLSRRVIREFVDPSVALALARLGAPGGCSIGRLARETGYSHRWLIGRFRRIVGLSPKVYARIRRFQGAIELAARGGSRGWAEVAVDCGFYDQAHLSREFQAFAGLPPGAYAPLSEDRPNHVPLLDSGGRARTYKTVARTSR
ncbi:MAG: AraC family transcriptional regulator [Planctomycetes bacterium]|nr:AraC family transcriptional regulator [Planctomycetota bacterium]